MISALLALGALVLLDRLIRWDARRLNARLLGRVFDGNNRP